MPLFFHQHIDKTTRLAAWKIEEEEAFFTGQVPLQREITHPQKRRQHLAGRYLLIQLFPEFPVSLIQVANTMKPFLESEAFHFSISHCGDYAAAIVSRENRVGIDLELISSKVERVGPKFISEGERLLFQRPDLSPAQLSTLIWSCKEAVFKWYGEGEVDFREHITIRSVVELTAGRYRSVVSFQKTEELFLTLENYFLGQLCLSFVIT